MIRIIEKGTRQTRTCENCGCRFSFEAEDIEVARELPICGGKITGRAYIKCPQCGKQITLKQEK